MYIAISLVKKQFMRRNYDEGYIELYQRVKEKLPRYYVAILQIKYPKLKPDRVRNVFNHGVQDWTVLIAMANSLGIEHNEKNELR